MNLNSQKRSRNGFTVIDILLVISCLVLAASFFFRLPELVEFSKHKACSFNQDRLTTALYNVLSDNREEIYHVAMAYAVRSNLPEQPSKIVVLLTPKDGVNWDRMIVADATASLANMNMTCPVHTDAAQNRISIDYAFIWSRWRCLIQENHN